MSRKEFLFLKGAPGSRKTLIDWQWLMGAATTKADFGDPLTTDSYQLCSYDGTPRVIVTATAPAGGVCGVRHRKTCWTETPHGFLYGDSDPNGAQTLLLREGAAGKAAIIFVGKGTNVDMPARPLAQPVTVQLHNSSGMCWEATYSAPAIKNTGGRHPEFMDKAD